MRQLNCYNITRNITALLFNCDFLSTLLVNRGCDYQDSNGSK